MSGKRERNLKRNSLSNQPVIHTATTPPPSLDDVLRMESLIGIQKQLALEKAFTSNDVATILKAQNYLQQIGSKDGGEIKSILVDPLDSSASFGYKHKPHSLSYDMLRGMAKTHVIKAIIQTRKAQIQKFCEPQSDRYTSGFKIEKKNKWRNSEKDKKLTKEEERKVDDITQFILDCGTSENTWNADTFPTFMGKLMEDSLVLDQACMEVTRNRKGVPVQFISVDSATFRIADNSKCKKEDEINGYFPQFIQVYQGRVYESFYPWEVSFGVRNPSSDIRTNGYGRSELEDMIQLITSLLNADAYNANFFKVGSSPQGILSYSGNINPNTLDSFKQQWQAQVAGVANAHKIPLINADKINFIPTHIPNKDMEYGRFQEFLIKCGCAGYTIDPSEIGFPMSGNSGGESGLGGANNKEKLKYSKDKGLTPLLKNCQHWLNKHVVSQKDSEFELRFVGIDDIEDRDNELDRDIKEVQNIMTVNEKRAKRNLPKLKGMDIILNPVASQAYMASIQGNNESNEAVDEMGDDDYNDNPNPFMKSLSADLERLLCENK